MSLHAKVLAVSVFITLILFTSVASAAEVEVLWLGHSTTRITSTTGKVIVIDPFLTKNPKAPAEYRNLEALGRVDLILVTHGHSDHVGDLQALVRLTGAKVVAPYEYANNLVAFGVLEGNSVISMNKGGYVQPLGRDIKIHMVRAEHSSSFDLRVFGLQESQSNGPRHIAGGEPVGYVIVLENGFTVYHSGDTGIFGDMRLIGELYAPDLALVCIGGYFTMGPEGAAYAVNELIKPRQVIPIHYGTYPVINRTPEEFREALGDGPVEMLDVVPGQAVTF